MTVYNTAGNLIYLADLKPPDRTVTWDSQELPGGIYTFILESGDKLVIRKAVKAD